MSSDLRAVRQRQPGLFQVDAERCWGHSLLSPGTKLTCPWGRPRPHQAIASVRQRPVRVRDTNRSPNGRWPLRSCLLVVVWLCAGDASFQTPPPPTAGSTPGRPWPARRWWWWAHGTRADKLSGEAQAVARWPAAATCLCGHPHWRFCWGSDPAAAHLSLGWSSAETSAQPTHTLQSDS